MKRAQSIIDSLTQPNSTASANPRVEWVDYAKGFCIVFVVMMHSTLGVEKSAGTEGWMNYIVAFAAPFRMPDFFLISGLFLASVIDRPWRRYFDRKVVHFLYFYILWMTIQFVFKAPGWLGEGMSAGDIATRFVMGFVQPFGTLWFIYALPIFFLVARFLEPLPWVLVLIGAAILEIMPVETHWMLSESMASSLGFSHFNGWVLIDEFAARFVYFYAGFKLAPYLFQLVDWALENIGKSIALLVTWAFVNGVLVFAPVPETISYLATSLGHKGPASLSQMPFISLLLGSMGAGAVVLISALLSKIKWSGFLSYLGANSIVVYLAFFLPMAVSRVILLKFAPFLDVGTVSLLVTLSAVAGPVIFYWFIQLTGYGKFLFHRPDWAITDNSVPKSTRAKLHPAE